MTLIYRVDSGVLTISSENKESHQNKRDNFTRRKFSYQYFRRSFTLPEAMKVEHIGAKYEKSLAYVYNKRGL